MAIADKTRKILWALSGNRCARDWVHLIEPGANLAPNAVVGEECHIVAREDDGPRGDPSYPRRLRDEIDNLILLCPTCHTIVDAQSAVYTVDRLRAMRADHEAKVERLISGHDAADAERQAIAAYYQAFDRYAFRLAMHHEEPRSFYQAIRDTRIAVTTGVVRLHDREVVTRVIGKSLFKDSETRQRMDRVADFLRQIEVACVDATSSGALDPDLISYDEAFLSLMDQLRNQLIQEVNLVFRKYGFDELAGIKAPVIRGLGHTTTAISRWHLLGHSYEDAPAPRPITMRREDSSVITIPANRQPSNGTSWSRATAQKALSSTLPPVLSVFFEKFDLFADAPNAVVKLRELVLQLAVRGQLVPQDHNDDPARDAEIPLGKLLSEDSLNGYSKAPSNSPPGVPILRISAGTSRSNFVVDESDHKWIQDDHDVEKFVLQPNDLLACRFNGNLHYVGRFSLYLGTSGQKQINPDKLIRFRVDQTRCDPRYVCFAMNARQTRDKIEAFCATTAGNIGISASNLKTVTIRVPPLAEQKRIVEKVDQLLELCDELAARQAARREARERLVGATLDRLVSARSSAEFPAHAHRLRDHFDRLFDTPTTIPQIRQAILQLAVQGQLVPQDPNDEPAAIDASDADVRGLFDVPDQWRWVTVEQIADSRLGKMLDKEKNKGTPFGYLRNTNVHWFRFDLSSIKEMPFADDELDEFEVRPGDVLICEGGHGIGRTAVWNGELKRVMFQKALHRVRPSRDLDGNFFAYCMRVYDSTGVLQTYYTGAGIPHLTGRSLAKVAFPLPPLSEQKRIVSKVTELLSLCDALEAKLTQAESASTRLLSAAVSHLLNAPSESQGTPP